MWFDARAKLAEIAGEPENAQFVGGGGPTREPGESADAFRARAHAAVREP
jgi:hypothetical protein